jgi:hypothetical protein
LQEVVCIALGHLAKGSAMNMDRLGRAGAIEAVETAWRRHAASEDEQPQARGALFTLGKIYLTGLGDWMRTCPSARLRGTCPWE